MTEPPFHLTPAEDADHGRLAMLACETALDEMAAGLNNADRDAWIRAARAFTDAALQCRHAAAQLYRRWARVQAAQGLWPCSHCHAWFPKDELEEQQIVYGGGETGKTSTWLTCGECLAAIRQQAAGRTTAPVQAIQAEGESDA